MTPDLEGTVGCFVLGLANAVTARQEDVIIVLLICLVVAMIASALLISRVAHWQLLKKDPDKAFLSPFHRHKPAHPGTGPRLSLSMSY